MMATVTRYLPAVEKTKGAVFVVWVMSEVPLMAPHAMSVWVAPV